MVASALSMRTRGAPLIGRKRKNVTKVTSVPQKGSLKLKRACVACTKSKVKCIKKEGESSCLLCLKRGCQCVYQPRRNRQRSRENSQKNGQTLVKSEVNFEQERHPEVYKESLVYPTNSLNSRHEQFCKSNPIPNLYDNTVFNDYDLDFVAEVLLDPEHKHTNKPITLDMPQEENWGLTADLFENERTYESIESFSLDQLFYDSSSNLAAY
mmetsp:Transcript_26797/g.37598  ORF Transcript_26797/g.37598 Transcript_26797/m.37598 type:complete len:211 (+) Transcript_26797:22-654(+)